MDYTVVFDSDQIEFEKRVNSLIEAGWKLHGGVSVSVSESDDYKYVYFAQALVKVTGKKVD